MVAGGRGFSGTYLDSNSSPKISFSTMKLRSPTEQINGTGPESHGQRFRSRRVGGRRRRAGARPRQEARAVAIGGKGACRARQRGDRGSRKKRGGAARRADG